MKSALTSESVKRERGKSMKPDNVFATIKIQNLDEALRLLSTIQDSITRLQSLDLAIQLDVPKTSEVSQDDKPSA